MSFPELTLNWSTIYAVGLKNYKVFLSLYAKKYTRFSTHCRYRSTGHQLKGSRKFMLNLCTNHTSTMKPHFVINNFKSLLLYFISLA